MSRLVSGHRLPSVTLMADIQQVLGWSYDGQCDAYMQRKYGELLQVKLDEWRPTEEELAAEPIRRTRRVGSERLTTG